MLTPISPFPRQTVIPTSTPIKSTAPLIPQTLLARYYEACAERRAAADRCKQLRKCLLEQYEADLPVEPGQFELYIKQTPTESWTRTAMEKILSPAAFEWLRARLPAVEHTYVKVRVAK
jgi:hypothetical protein